MYKLIALDMDGTLLKEDKTISEKTKEAIKKAKEKGVKVVLASGRPLEGLERYLDELELYGEDDYVICYNGSQVQKTKSKKIITTRGLRGEDFKKLYKLSRELDVNMHAFSKDGKLITPIKTKYTELEGRINGIPVVEINVDEVNDNDEIVKVMLVDEPEELEKALKKLPQDIFKKYTVVRSAPFFSEFLNPEANKGSGVKALCDHLNIKPQEVITVGDAGNDTHMIEFAGLGVAMGNAFEELKEKANYITKTNEEDGVAHVINKFILEA